RHVGEPDHFQGDPGDGGGPDQRQRPPALPALEDNAVYRGKRPRNQDEDGAVIQPVEYRAPGAARWQQMVYPANGKEEHHREDVYSEKSHPGAVPPAAAEQEGGQDGKHTRGQKVTEGADRLAEPRNGVYCRYGLQGALRDLISADTGSPPPATMNHTGAA